MTRLPSRQFAAGEPIVDHFWEKTCRDSGEHDVNFWINHVADDGATLVDLGFKRLIQRGILEESEKRFLWSMKTRFYPIIGGTHEREVKLRIMNILDSNEFPDNRDILIIALLDACDMLQNLLEPVEITRVRESISQVSRLDDIGRETTKLVRGIQVALVATHAPLFQEITTSP